MADSTAAVSDVALPLVDYSLPRDKVHKPPIAPHRLFKLLAKFGAPASSSTSHKWACNERKIAAQVRSALQDYGFMLLENSGQMENIAALRAASLDFFKLPESDSAKVKAAGEPGAIRGYYAERALNTAKALGKDGPPDYCSQFFMGDEGTGNRFPSEEYEAKVTTVYNGFAEIAKNLTQIVVDVYGLPNTWVKEEFEAPTLTSFKVIHYPVPPEEECKGLRMTNHFDVDALTVLYQDAHVPGGLQVNLHGEWQDVQAPPNTLVINVGEVLKFLSGGEVKCTEHRVVMPRPEDRERSERMSMALFLAPKPSTPLKPLGSQIATGAQKDDGIPAGEWFQAALAKFHEKNKKS